MTTNFRKRLRAMETCTHDSVTRTVNAGISRTVCEICGHVQVEFASATFAAETVQKPVAVSV